MQYAIAYTLHSFIIVSTFSGEESCPDRVCKGCSVPVKIYQVKGFAVERQFTFQIRSMFYEDEVFGSRIMLMYQLGRQGCNALRKAYPGSGGIVQLQ